MDVQICGIVSNSGYKGEPLACGWKKGHEGEHSWSTLPTFDKAFGEQRRLEQDALADLKIIDEQIKKHQEKQGWHYSRGRTSERYTDTLAHYESIATEALTGAKYFRDDILVNFRAIGLVLEMVSNASTHSEKNARLRGAIDLIESSINKLRNFSFSFNHYAWPDVFRCDYPVRTFIEKMHEMERELEELRKQNGDQPAQEETENILF